MRKHQDKRAFIAFNTHLIVYGVFFITVVFFFICAAISGESLMAVVLALLALLAIVVFFMSPLYFIFNDDGVEIIYNFGYKEIIKWGCIRTISLRGGWLSGRVAPHYVFDYINSKYSRFFNTGEIPKTRKTKKLIDYYYKKNIDK